MHRVDEGWDPIPADYAELYAEKAWHIYNSEALVDRLSELAHGLENKRVLDLGGGPGQYSVLFARRGARVTWHDVSRQYEKIASARFLAAGVQIERSLGYLEDAQKFGPASFDIVFSRVSWMYCRNDRHFARLLMSLVRPGGLAYIECDTPIHAKPKGLRGWQHRLNEYAGWKIGHPLPPQGRIGRLISKYPVRFLQFDYSSPLQDKVIFIKA